MRRLALAITLRCYRMLSFDRFYADRDPNQGHPRLRYYLLLEISLVSILCQDVESNDTI